MAGAKAQYRTQQNTKRIVLVLLCSSFALPVGMVSAWATPVERAYSCGSLRSMARVYMASGGYEKAQPFLEKALRLAKKTNASDTEMCACVLDLAYLYKNQGKLAEAETMCQSGIELQEKVYGRNHPYVAYTLRILSGIYQGQARYREAADSLERAMTIMGRVSREGGQEIAPFKVDMARLLVAQGDFAQAESYFKKAIASIENSYGPEHVYTTRVLGSMAGLYALQKRYAEAEKLIARTLPIQEKVYGPDHHLLIPVWLVMSRIYQAKGDLVNAKMLLEKSLRAAENQGNSGHLVEGDVLSQLGEFYIFSEEHTEAERALERALKAFESSQGTNSDRTAIALNSLAKVYINQGKYSKAQSLCRRALKILESIFDRYHPNVADVLETLAQLNRETGNMAEAARLEQRVEEIRVRRRVAFGPVAAAIK
ncbi:MAG: tetratricopeptide repeat protein [Phycisphaerales bacterium]